MNQEDTDYLTMTGVATKMLTAREAEWKDSPPATRKIASIRASYATLGKAQQGNTTVTTGITEDRETAVEKAQDEALLLSKAVRSYALDKGNMTLYNQFKISDRFLNRFSNEELIPYLKDMLQRIRDIGAEGTDFGLTVARLTDFEALIAEVEKRKSDTRNAVVDRMGHNQTIPQLMKELKKDFAILDNLIGSWKNEKPDFVRDYFNARKVINTGGRGGGGKDDKGGEKPKV